LTAGAPAAEAQFGALVEYVREWAQLLANNQNQGRLATPIQAQDVTATSMSSNTCPTVIRRQQSAVRLLFLPTNTGNRYRSKDEERERERASDASASNSGVSARRATMAKEGGVEFVVEVLKQDNRLRVRAKRCNYGDDTVIKELSEKTILSRFRQCMEVWQKDHAAQ
jgi:hypothetical protein